MAPVQSVIFFLNLKGEFKRHRSPFDRNWLDSGSSDLRFAESESFNPSSQSADPDLRSYSRSDRGASVEPCEFSTEPLIRSLSRSVVLP